jgi:DNA-binding NtrC family response regulator
VGLVLQGKLAGKISGKDTKINHEMGEIRELQNTIERLKILSDGDTIKVEDIPYAIRMPKSKSETAEFSVDMPLESLEKGHILRTLTYYHGNKTKTANSLGITVKTLYNKLHRYGVAVGDSMSTEESLGNKN